MAEDQEPPNNVKDVKAYLRFLNFYRRFTLRYSQIVATVTGLTKKNVLWCWNNNRPVKLSFKTLKAFIRPPTLFNLDPDKKNW